MRIIKILLFFVLFVQLSAQENEIEFENISTFSGLSASQAKCVFQDSDGFLWIGTLEGGLNHYDGYSFKVYKSNASDSSSLIHNNIYSLTEDRDGNIWIATSLGLSKYQKHENKFINYHFRELFEELSNIGYYSTYEVFVDSQDRLWVGDSYFGALLYDKDKDIFEPIPQKLSDTIDPYPQVYGDFSEDKNGIIWASAGSSGLFWFDEESNNFLPAKMDPKNWDLLKSKEIFRVLADSENNIWIMTRTDLFKYLTDSKELLSLLSYEVPSPINGGYEGELLEDSEGNMIVVHISLPDPIFFPKLSIEFVILNSVNIYPTDIYEDSFGLQIGIKVSISM